MTKIGLLSDTHNFIHPKIFEFFKDCDEIWHAGDIGNIQTAEKLNDFKPLKAVRGNIDGQDVRIVYPETLRFTCEKVNILLTHIGGYPGNYSTRVKDELKNNPPKLFICGHSHILKIIYDKRFDFLHINPGAAGKYGQHKVITFIRFAIDGRDIKNMEIMELQR